ncbi:putative endonuclease [Peptoclostridium litorale DSM 5388]|uniref:Excinuclease ABC domain-containing protein n=1 Tax=Peptoclostridium litorale DSM 5388 TaxID=1121324 RepID=A0A069RBD9_PEPLI|nr:GIY-YIG nuclease family protein [Peptoclostridium litorale]KDR94356.1 excinuclease ABC domain-containing protein [Peptoclostridium litorale DSM 5388]SIO37440.1 putative endonuclease [Peptoclostridium litorale DSM 5388]
MAYTYMLRCSDNTLYTGWTKDIERRLLEHNRGKASKYTRVRLPVELAYLEEYESDSDARKREVQIKKLTRAKKLSLIEGCESDIDKG